MQKDEKRISPCDYCGNPKNDASSDHCFESACYEYSRWQNNSKAPRSVVETVEDFHFDRW